MPRIRLVAIAAAIAFAPLQAVAQQILPRMEGPMRMPVDVQPLTPAVMFLDATPVVKLMMVVAIAGFLAAVGVFALELLARGKAARTGAPHDPARAPGLLASIGSVSVLAGVLGALYGLMNAFIGVAMTNTTNLAVVAPGVAEALLAVVMGVFAALVATVLAAVLRLRRAAA